VLRGTVEVVEPLIAERAQLVHLALTPDTGGAGGRAGAPEETPPVLAATDGTGGTGTTLTARLAPEAQVYRREEVLLAVDAGDVLVFDPAAGGALLS
jgi:hypothetical protein